MHQDLDKVEDLTGLPDADLIAASEALKTPDGAVEDYQFAMAAALVSIAGNLSRLVAGLEMDRLNRRVEREESER